jgi:hypothetical protein
MCFQVYFKSSHRYIERELESSAKTKASTPLYYSSFAVALCHSPSLGERTKGLRLWYNLNSFIFDQRGREYFKGLYFIPSIRFWRFMPKGEKVLAQSKRTAPPTLILNINDVQLVNFKLVYLYVLKGEQVVFSKLLS